MSKTVKPDPLQSLLDEAMSLLKDGRSVWIVAADEPQRRHVLKQFSANLGFRLSVSTVSATAIDWQKMTILSCPEHIVLLFTKEAIEQKFSKLLQEYSRYQACACLAG